MKEREEREKERGRGTGRKGEREREIERERERERGLHCHGCHRSSYGQTSLATPDLVRSGKLSRVGPG